MVHRWETVTFLHWRMEPSQVQRLVPPGLQVETCDGSAWVSLVPLSMLVTAPGAPELPWLSRFLETNVRTYVRDEAGRPGLWFFSLDATRLAVVAVARSTYRLPYFWSAIRLRRDGNRLHHNCARRWSSRGARSRTVVEIGEAYGDGELGELDHFLTARWRLFSTVGGRLWLTRAAHVPWPLQRARPVDLADELVPATGLPSPSGEPLAHFSPGVQVRVGPPERARAHPRPRT